MHSNVITSLSQGDQSWFVEKSFLYALNVQKMNLMVIISRLLHFRPYFQSDNGLKCEKGSNYSVFHTQQDFIKRDNKNIVGYGYLTILPCIYQPSMNKEKWRKLGSKIEPKLNL